MYNCSKVSFIIPMVRHSLILNHRADIFLKYLDMNSMTSTNS